MRNLKSTPFGRMMASLFLSLVLIGGLVLALAGTVSPAFAQSCSVPGTYATIQLAIDAGSGVCDTITVSAGTFNENLTIGRSLTLNGAGKTSTIINGGGTDRVVTIDGSGIEVWLNDLTVTGGDATSVSTSSPTFGGGILVKGGATLRGENLQVEDNLASTGTNGRGGGLAIDTGSAYLTSTMFISNTANRRSGVLTGNGQGGGLYLNIGTLQMYSSQIMSNTAAYRAGASSFAAGGGLYVNQNAQVYLYSNTWQGNVARGSNSNPCDTSCVNANNSEGGGGIGVFPSNSTAEITITGDTFSGNVANDVTTAADNGGHGGGISLNATSGQVTATLTALTMNENIAARTGQGNDVDEEGQGGAIWARSTRLTVERANIYDNESAASGVGSGGGIYAREIKGDIDVNNSIVASNSAPGGAGSGAEIYLNLTGAVNNEVARIAHVTLAEKGASVNPKEGLYYDGSGGNGLLITNTIVASHTTGIANAGNPSEVTIDYILFYGNTSDSDAGVPAPANQVTGQDPLFVDPAGNNFHIQGDSPAIDVAPSGLSTDIDGDNRPQGNGFDLGADEAGGTVYLPLVIKNYGG